jgi:hypothetical protein
MWHYAASTDLAEPTWILGWIFVSGGCMTGLA